MPSLKVALLCGAWPPARCGVADYSETLATALEGEGARVVRVTPGPRLYDAGRVVREVAAAGVDLAHVQYPSVGWGRAVLPSLLPLLLRRLPVVVTLHEFSIFRWYRLPWFAGFAYGAAAMVVTSDAERDAFQARLPGAAAPAVIPIGSNIPRAARRARLPRSVCYFGLLMPRKGLEDFLAFAGALQGQGQWRIRLIGAVAPGCEAYADGVLRRARALCCEIFLGEPPAAVAALLSETAFAYLPGPGGVTERRGSVLAALENGVQVLGPVGARAPDWLRRRVWHTPTPAAAAGRLLPLERGDAEPAPVEEIQWDRIAQRHLALYGRVTTPVAVAA